MITSIDSTHDRVVRVFVSSTFRDMQAERDYLVKHVFPELRARCKARQVEFVEVDLRWGITEEQAERGEVLPLCMAEIEHCSPYFISMLGERYGYVPEMIPEGLLEDHPWLSEHRERSITELEIVHGVLNEPVMASRAFFYFRDPSFIEQLPDGVRQQHSAENAVAATKLVDLKNRIRDFSPNVRENYHDSVRLGELVLADLWHAIEREYPAGIVIDPLDRLDAEHKSYGRSRAQIYISRQEYFERLDSHVFEKGVPLVVLGESGSGKSALLSNWLLKPEPVVHPINRPPKSFVFYHFVGSSPESADISTLLKRLFGALKRRYGFKDEIPSELNKLREVLPLWLARASANFGSIVLVIDGLNQLEDRGNALDLGWLPEHFPPNVRVIVSTLPGRSLDALNKRNWQQLVIKPLDIAERKQLVSKYLAVYRKTLQADRVERIISAPQAANPLYLRSLIEELRIFGVHEKLDETIGHYLAARSVVDLFNLILERYELDYEYNRPSLVSDAMSLIWGARLGIPENELTLLLGNADSTLPAAFWSPLHLAAEQNLVNRSGLISFSHDYFRQAVELRYLHDPQNKQRVHQKLADYFVNLRLDERKVAELPWQQYQAKKDKELCLTLTEPELLITAVESGKLSDWGVYWSYLGNNFDAAYEHLDTFREIKKIPAYDDLLLEFLDASGSVLEFLGYYKDAEHFYIEELQAVQKQEDESYFVVINNKLIDVLIKQNKFKEAMERLAIVYEMTIEIPILCSTVNKMAGLYAEQGYFDEADRQLKRSEQHLDELPSEIVGATMLARAGVSVLSKEYKLEFARTDTDAVPEKFAVAALDFIQRESGVHHPDYVCAACHLAKARQMAGKQADALQLALEAIEIACRIFGEDHLETAKSLVCLADIYFDEGGFGEAESNYSKALDLFQKHACITLDHIHVLGRLAIIFRATQRVNDAEHIENLADLLRGEAMKKWGTLSSAFLAARTSSRSAGINKAFLSFTFYHSKNVAAWISGFGERLAESIVMLLVLSSSIGLSILFSGTLERFAVNRGVPGSFRVITSFIGQILLVGAFGGYTGFFRSFLRIKQNKYAVLLGYGSYTGTFFLLRDLLHYYPSSTSPFVIYIVGGGLLLSVTNNLIKTRHNYGELFAYRFLLMMLPVSVLKRIAIYKLGPRIESATKDELIAAISGNTLEISNMSLANNAIGLSYYELADEDSVASNVTVIQENNKTAWLRHGIIAAMIVLLFSILKEYSQMLPGTGTGKEGVGWYSSFALIICVIFHGVIMARKSISLWKTMALEMAIVLPGVALLLIVQGRTGSLAILNALASVLIIYIVLSMIYGFTRHVIAASAYAALPKAYLERAVQPGFSLIVSIVGALIVPFIFLMSRVIFKVILNGVDIPTWAGVFMLLVCAIGIALYGFELARRYMSVWRTVALQAPLFFVFFSASVMIIKPNGNVVKPAFASVILFNTILLVSFYISQKQLKKTVRNVDS